MWIFPELIGIEGKTLRKRNGMVARRKRQIPVIATPETTANRALRSGNGAGCKVWFRVQGRSCVTWACKVGFRPACLESDLSGVEIWILMLGERQCGRKSLKTEILFFGYE